MHTLCFLDSRGQLNSVSRRQLVCGKAVWGTAELSSKVCKLAKVSR